MEEKKEVIDFIKNASVFLLAALLLVFPLLIFTKLTDVFIMPKQVALTVIISIAVILMCARMILEKTIKIRRTPFDLAIIIFAASLLLSAIFAVNRIDSIISFIPVFFAAVSYFVIVNFAKDKKSVLILLSAFIGGAVITSFLSIFSFLKIYSLPFAFTKTPTFTPLGSLLDQAIYLALVLPIAVDLAWPIISSFLEGKKEKSTFETVPGRPKEDNLTKNIAFAASSLVILVALVITVYQLIYVQKPILLPFGIGFQTAFAEISQDTGRVAQGFFFGSGYGTYGTDFTRFKPATFNQDQMLWSVIFFKSSSFVLELLATAGILGLLSFIFLTYRIVKEKPVFVPLILIIIIAFLSPFSYITIASLFILLGLFSAMQGLRHTQRYFDVELQLVALRKGLISLESPESTVTSNKSKILPYIIVVITVAVVGTVGYFSVNYLMADSKFQESLIAISKNNGSQAYKSQVEALQAFGSSDTYNRVFSQTNLALANTLSMSLPKDSSPSAQTVQTIYTLIQQSINSGRNATTISPMTALNWQNLSYVYKNLIGFGKNADSFAVLAAQQSIQLDPSNPQEYINLGGIYYQLGMWDNAIQQFRLAVNLKPDFANAYYNLGYALKQKGDLANALVSFQTVKSLVASDKPNLDKINAEISALQKQIESTVSGQSSETANPSISQNQPDLNLSTSSAQLPKQLPQIKISPPPGIKVTPSVTKTEATPQPSPDVNLNQ